jgi:hypothetical protein
VRGLARLRGLIPFVSAVALGAAGGGLAFAQASPPAGFDYRAQVTAISPGEQPVERTYWVRQGMCGKVFEGWRPEGVGRVSVGRCVRVR